MLVSGIVVVCLLGGILVALALAGGALALVDKHFNNRRRHWAPAESSSHW